MNKNLLLRKIVHLFLLLAALTAHGQTLILEYEFAGNTKDGSGNNYDATLAGNANTISGAGACNDGCVNIPKDSLSYVIVPATALNGLTDFSIKTVFIMKGNFTEEDPDISFTVFSGSRNGCINCFGLSYSPYFQRWEIDLSGNTHYITDSTFYGFANSLKLERYNGTIQLSYKGNDSVGSAFDNSPIDITSFQLGQRDYCEGGCYQYTQSLHGNIDRFELWNSPIFLGTGGEGLTEDFLVVFPNPACSTLKLDYSLNVSSPLYIINVLGRIVKQFNLNTSSHSITIPTTDFADGVYFVSLSDGDKRISKKLVISK